MDPLYSLQDVVRCKMCDTPDPLLYCKTCDINLCKACVGDHHLDVAITHIVVLFKNRKCNYPKCAKHTNSQSESHCEECDLPVCTKCALNCKKKRGHKTVDILHKIKSKKEIIFRDLKELKIDILPKFEEVSSNISDQKTDLENNYHALTADINKLGADWHSILTQ